MIMMLKEEEREALKDFLEKYSKFEYHSHCYEDDLYENELLHHLIQDIINKNYQEIIDFCKYKKSNGRYFVGDILNDIYNRLGSKKNHIYDILFFKNVSEYTEIISEKDIICYVSKYYKHIKEYEDNYTFIDDVYDSDGYSGYSILDFIREQFNDIFNVNLRKGFIEYCKKYLVNISK